MEAPGRRVDDCLTYDFSNGEYSGRSTRMGARISSETIEACHTASPKDRDHLLTETPVSRDTVWTKQSGQTYRRHGFRSNPAGVSESLSDQERQAERARIDVRVPQYRTGK